MPQLIDLFYFIEVDGEQVPFQDNLTVGRHLNNDVVAAGEDVLDYHLRIEVTPSGPRVHPLGEATLTVNGQLYSEPRGLIDGDRLMVGQSDMVIVVQPDQPPAVSEWWLHGTYGREPLKLDRPLSIGRGEHCDVLLMDDHISREHARLSLAADVVWLQDLDSANGTFVNGEQVVGGCRLFHGDFLKLDVVEFQLVGKGDDLTPTRTYWDTAEHALMKDSPNAEADTTEITAIEDVQEVAPVHAPEGATGAFLIGAGAPLAGKTFRIGMGRTTIGRSDDCDIVINDRTVSLRHVELIRRPEGCTLSNLLATNGSRINGREAQSAELRDGDVLRLGSVGLVYKEVAGPGSTTPRRRGSTLLLLAGAAVVAAVLAWALLAR
jgi:pSer/pThr/pTyr-binding forkhead associated (FHA) protein